MRLLFFAVWYLCKIELNGWKQSQNFPLALPALISGSKRFHQSSKICPPGYCALPCFCNPQCICFSLPESGSSSPSRLALLQRASDTSLLSHFIVIVISCLWNLRSPIPVLFSKPSSLRPIIVLRICPMNWQQVDLYWRKSVFAICSQRRASLRQSKLCGN
jgi:hypothetical protein